MAEHATAEDSPGPSVMKETAVDDTSKRK